MKVIKQSEPSSASARDVRTAGKENLVTLTKTSPPTLVYIITQNSDWNKIGSDENYLKDFQNPSNSFFSSGSSYHSYAVLEEKDKIYLTGGQTRVW